MTTENYPRCLANTLNEEGGWSNHPSDPGGPTMRGVIQREYSKYRAEKGLPQQSVRYISEEELQEIYAGNYWKPVYGDQWPKGPDQIVFDIAVNSGLGRANKIMAAALGTNELRYAPLAARAAASPDKAEVVKRACARRESFYRQIGTFGVFGRGWLRRNASMEAIGVRMCIEAENGDVSGGLQREGASARVKAKRSGQGAAGAGGGTATGGGSLTQVDAAGWDWTVWLTISLVAVGAIALTLALVYLWRKHGERAKAYAAAIRGELETDLASVLARVKGESK